MDEKLIGALVALGKSSLQFLLTGAALVLNTGRAVFNLLGRMFGLGGGSSGQSAPPQQQGASQSSPEGQRQGSGKGLTASVQELLLGIKNLVGAGINLGRALGTVALAVGKAVWNGAVDLVSKNARQKPTGADAPPAARKTPSQGSSMSNDGQKASQVVAQQQTLPPLSTGLLRETSPTLSSGRTLVDRPPWQFPENPGTPLRRANSAPPQLTGTPQPRRRADSTRPMLGSYDGKTPVQDKKLELALKRRHSL